VLDGGFDLPTARGGGFDAAFAKLLWPLVLVITTYSSKSAKEMNVHYTRESNWLRFFRHTLA